MHLSAQRRLWLNATLCREAFLGCRLHLDFDSQAVWTFDRSGFNFDPSPFDFADESFAFGHRFSKPVSSAVVTLPK